jgi:predicted alpha/beta superfamily hydrolase
MKMSHLIILLILHCSNAYAKTLEVIINAPFNTPLNQKIYLTGEIPGLCSWEVKCAELKEIFPRVFRLVIEFADSTDVILIKITRGSWSTQAADSRGRIFPNRGVETIKDHGRLILTLPNWQGLVGPGVKGNLKKIEDFKAAPLPGTKNIWVWLPPSYKRSTQKHYPVIYMHDGQNVFNPMTASFGNEWSVDEVLSDLISKKKIRESIVISASSSRSNRNGEYTFNREGHLYAKFLTQNLKPFIDSKFRTLSGRDNTFLMGSSMGALISFTTLWKYPEVFSKAAGLSFPPFAHDDNLFYWLEKEDLPSKEIDFYLDHGTVGQDGTYLEHVLRFKKVLLKKGFPMKSLEYQVFPYADHTELDWARRVNIPLQYLLK